MGQVHCPRHGTSPLMIVSRDVRERIVAGHRVSELRAIRRIHIDEDDPEDHSDVMIAGYVSPEYLKAWGVSDPPPPVLEGDAPPPAWVEAVNRTPVCLRCLTEAYDGDPDLLPLRFG